MKSSLVTRRHFLLCAGIEGAGHSIPEERSKHVNRLLIEFLSQTKRG